MTLEKFLDKFEKLKKKYGMIEFQLKFFHNEEELPVKMHIFPTSTFKNLLNPQKWYIRVNLVIVEKQKTKKSMDILEILYKTQTNKAAKEIIDLSKQKMSEYENFKKLLIFLYIHSKSSTLLTDINKIKKIYDILHTTDYNRFFNNVQVKKELILK